MAGVDMKSLSTHRRTPAAAAEVNAKKAKRTEADGTLPAHDVFMALVNASGPKQTDQLKELTKAMAALLRGV